MHFTLLRTQEHIPVHLRRLIYVSLALTIPTLAFSLSNLGLYSYFITPAALVCTWIYHTVLIVHHNKGARTDQSSPLAWTKKHALIWGYLLAVVWTAASAMTLFVDIIVFALGDGGELDGYFALAVFDIIFVFSSTIVMWSLIATSTVLRRRSKRNAETTETSSLSDLKVADV